MKILGWIRVGDKAACGGTVAEGFDSARYNGIPYSFKGARMNCAQQCVIAEAIEFLKLPNGQYIPHHGHRTSAGCPLLSTANEKCGYRNAAGSPVPENFEKDSSGNWVGCAAVTPSNAALSSDTTGTTATSKSPTQIVEQYFALLYEDGAPADGYRYDLHQNNVLHVQSAALRNGLTVPVSGDADLKLVAWLIQDGGAKNA